MELFQTIRPLLIIAVLAPLCLSSSFDYKKLFKSVSDKEMQFDSNNFKIKPSIDSWDTTSQKKSFSIISMIVDHHSPSSWYIPHLHDKYTAGWNRSTLKGFLNSPFACDVRFYAIALESTLQGFEKGGTGYLAIEFENEHQKKFWHGYDKNETNKVHCYYKTNKDCGSEFLVCE
jgi:hypothetical protein